MRLLRPLRLLVPLVALGGALVLFLVFALLADQIGPLGVVVPGQDGPGICDAGLRSTSRSAATAGATAATLNEEQRQNAATIIGVTRQKGTPRGLESAQHP